MRAFFTISWREIREGFPKFLLTVLSVSLGVAFLTGTLALRDTLADTFNGIVNLGSSAEIYVRGTKITEDGSSEQRRAVPAKLAAKIKAVIPGHALVTPSMAISSAQIFDKDETAIRNGGAPVMILPFYDDPLWGEVKEGRFPKGPREIMLLDTFMEEHGFSVGDSTQLTINGGKRTVTITGSTTAQESLFGAILIFMDREVVEPLALPDEQTTTIDIELPEGAPIGDLIQAIKPVVPANAVVVSGEQVRKEQAETIDTQLGFVNTFLLVFVFISLFIGSFVIANTFAMIVHQRMKQFAMLRAIGAKPAGIFLLVFAQALIIGIVGGILGIGLGMGLLAAIGQLLAYFGTPLGSLTMTPTVMMIGLVIGLIVTIAGALVSAKRAAVTDPLDVLRESGGAMAQPARWRVMVRFALLIVGLVLLVAGVMGNDYTILGVGAVMTLLGVLATLPYLAAPMIRLLVTVIAPLAPVPARLAKGNVLRNPKRTASTAGALVIGVSLVVAGSAFVSTIQGGVTSVLNNSIKSELLLFDKVGNNLGRPIPKTVVEEIKDEVDGISTIGLAQFGSHVVTHKGKTEQRMVSFYEPDMESFVQFKVIEGDGDALTQDDIVIVKTGGSDWEDFRIGDEIKIQSTLGQKRGRVGAIIEAPAMDFPMVVPLDWAKSLLPSDAGYSSVLINLDKDAEIDTVKADLNQLIGDEQTYAAMDKEELGGQSAEQLDRIVAILYGLLALSVITAFFGIINTLVLSVMDRVREIGMVRAIGMSQRQVMGMITIESCLITGFGLVMGIALGLGLSWSLVQTLGEFGIDRFVWPFSSLGGVTLGALGIAILAAIIPARQAAKINELQAMAA